MSHDHRPHDRPPQESRFKWALIAFFLIAGYFLVTEHRAHLYGWLSSYGIWLLLLACPLLHLFMHGGHGGHGRHHDPGSDDAPKGGER